MNTKIYKANTYPIICTFEKTNGFTLTTYYRHWVLEHAFRNDGIDTYIYVDTYGREYKMDKKIAATFFSEYTMFVRDEETGLETLRLKKENIDMIVRLKNLIRNSIDWTQFNCTQLN